MLGATWDLPISSRALRIVLTVHQQYNSLQKWEITQYYLVRKGVDIGRMQIHMACNPERELLFLASHRGP